MLTPPHSLHPHAGITFVEQSATFWNHNRPVEHVVHAKHYLLTEEATACRLLKGLRYQCVLLIVIVVGILPVLIMLMTRTPQGGLEAIRSRDNSRGSNGTMIVIEILAATC
ncbi:hypothetical protein BDR06DRAFT_949200 [Suillus hirtellus]|nr:hypothetical protein BDR06DRAFT_949200 [Suillus hirtellus]